MISQQLLERILDRAIAIQQIPAPTFSEAQRAAYVCTQFQEEGLQQVELDALNNVYGCLPGTGQAPPLVVSAHTDTVFPAGVPLECRREADRIFGPGIGDNSLGVAGLFGLLWALRAADMPLPGDLWLVANACEEGLGDLRGMRAVVERFADRPVAYLILEGMALGQVYRAGLGVKRFRINVQTTGGHSWVDFGRPSAIHELAALVTSLTGVSLPRIPRTSMNVGVFHGGTSVNTIAAEAHLELDLRSEGQRALTNLVRRVEQLVETANRPDVHIRLERIGDRPPGSLEEDHWLVKLARQNLEHVKIQPNLSIGSTDANVPLSRGLPAVCIGLSNGHGAHTVNEHINTRPLGQGLMQLVGLVNGVFNHALSAG